MSDQWIVITDPDGQEHRFPAAEYTETQAIQEVRRLRGERVNRSAWGDAGSLLTSGMGALESSIGGALDFVGLDEMGRPFQERGLSTQRRASTRYSPELARDLDQPGIQLGDVFAATVESAPGTAAIMAPGVGLGALGSVRGLQGLSGLARPASALLEGAQSGGGSVQAIEEAIRAYAISEPQAFAASEEGQRALREAGGDFGRAVEIAADRANGVWPALIGSFVGAVGFAGVDPADLFRTAGGRRQIANLLLNIPRRAGQEAAEEFIQSAGEQAGTNLAVGAIDPSRDLLDHVLESALLGAAAGGVGGTIFGGAESGAQGLRNMLMRSEINPQIEGDLEARRDDVNRGYDEAEGVTEEEITEPDLGQDDAVDASVLAGDEPPEDEGGMGLEEALFNFSNLFEGRGELEEPTDEEVRQATSDLVDAMVAAGLSEQEIFDAIESPDALIDLAESAVSDRGDVDATPEEDGGGDEAATDSGEDDGTQQEVSPRTRYYTDLDRIETAYNDREAAIQTDDFDAYEEAQSTLINAAEEIFGADYAAAYQEAFEADIAETGGENAPAIEAKLATDIENYLKEQGRLGGQEDGTQDAAEIAEDGGATDGEPAVVAGEADGGSLAPSDKGSGAALALPEQPTAEAVEEEMAAVTPPEAPKPTLEDIQSLTGIEDPDEFDAAVGERGWTAADLKALRDTLPKPDPNDIGTQAELYRSIGDAISAARKAEKAKGRSVSNKTPRPQTLGETRQTANPPVQQQDSASAPENKMVSGDTASILRALGNRSVTALQNNPNAMANLERAVSDAREQVGENRIGPATRTPKEFKTKAEWLISESKRLLTKAPAVKTPEQFGEDKISNRLADKDLAKPSKTRGEASASEPRATKSKDVLERVAAAIHDEWESHANSVYPDATAARQKSWAKNFGPYDGLTDEIQEYDRVEARPMIEAAGRAKTERDAINAIAAIERERHQRWINTVVSKNQVNEDAQAWLQSARAQKQFEERYKDFAKEIVAITGFGFAVEQQAAAPREEGKAVQPPNTSQTEAGSRGEETPEALPVDDEVDTAAEEPAQEPKSQKPLSMAEQLQRRLDEIDPTVPRPSEDYDTPTPSDPSLIDEMAEVATARNGKPYKDPSTRAQRQAERAFELAIGEPDPDGNVDLNDFNVDVFIDALNAIDGVFDRARAAQVAARYVDKETREEMIDRVYGFSAVANYLEESGDTLWGGLYSTKRKIPLKKLPREIRNLRRSQDNSVFRGNWRSPAHSGVKSVAERTRIYEFLKTTLIPALNRRRVKVPANPSLAEFAKVEGAYQDLLAAITAHINNDLTYEMRAELLHRRTGWLNEQVEMGRLETRTVDDIFHGATSGLYVGGDWRQYAGRSNGPAPQYTYEWQERKQALAVRLNQYLKQMGFSDVAGRIVDVVRNPDNMNPVEDASASYLAKLLIISMGGDEYTGDRSLNEMSLDEAFEQVKFRADHELVHAMRQLGLLTDGEWEVLKNFAYSHGLDENGRIVPVEKHKDSFRGQITDDPLYWNVLSKYPPSERNIIADEEAVAIAFQNLKKMPPRRAKGVFAKIGQIIRAIMRALRMAKILNPDQIYINAQDIAGQMMDGKVGARRRDYMRGAETSASAIVSRSSRLQSFMFRGLFGRRPRIDDPKSYTKITGPEGPRVDAGRFNMALMRHLNALNRPEREILMWAEIAVEIEHEIDALRQEDGFLVDEAKGMHYQQLHLDLSDAQDRRHQIINTIGNEFWDNNFLIGLMSAIIATRKPLSEITPEELSRYLDYGDQSRSGDADGQVFMMARSGYGRKSFNVNFVRRKMETGLGGKPKAILTELNKERARRGLAPASINTVQSIMQRLRKEGVVDITDPNYQSEYIAAAIGRLIAAVDDVVRQNDGKKPRGWVSTVAAQTGYEPASVETMWSNIKAGKYGEAAANDAKGVDGGRAGGRLRNDRDGQLYASRRRNPGALWDPKLFGQLPGYVPLPGRQYEINPLQMYSAAEKAATEFPTDRSNKFTMRKYLQRRVKKAELDYIGIDALLGGSGADKVTKQELVDFIRARKLKMDVRYYYGQHSDPAAKFGLFTHPGRSRWVDDQGGQRWVPDYDDSIIGGHARYTINPNEVIDNNYIEVAARLLEGPGSEFDYAHFGGPGTVWGFLASDYAVDLDGENVNAFMIHQGQSDLHDNGDNLYDYHRAVSRISNEVAREYRDNVMMPYLVEKRGWREVRSAPDNFDHALWRAPNGQVVWAPETFGGVWSGEDATTILNDPDGWLRSSGNLKEKMSELRAVVANGRQYSRAQYEKDVAEARDEETRKRLQEEYEDSEFFTQQWLDFVLPETEKRINAWLRENEAKPAPFEKSWPEAMFRHALMMAVSSGHDAIAWASGDTIRQYQGHSTYRGTFYDERWPTYARNWLKRFGAEVRKVNIETTELDESAFEQLPFEPFDQMLDNFMSDEAYDIRGEIMAQFSTNSVEDAGLNDFLDEVSNQMMEYNGRWTERLNDGLDIQTRNVIEDTRRYAEDSWDAMDPVDQRSLTENGITKKTFEEAAKAFARKYIERFPSVLQSVQEAHDPGPSKPVKRSIYVMRITPEMRAHFRETGGAQMFATRSRPHTISPGAKARSAVSDEISRRMGIQPPTARGFSNARKPGSTFLGQSPRERVRRVMELTQRQGQPRQWSKRVSSSLVTFLADQGRKLERSNPSLTLGHTIGRGLRNFAYGITTLGNLPGQGYYLTLRSLLMGDINAGIDHAERLNKLSERMTEKDYEQFRDYMLTRDAEPSSIENEDVRAAAVLSKELFSKFGEENVRIGRLDERQLKKYQGRYLPRKYFRYIENSLRTTGIRLGKEGYTRERLPGQDRQIFGALDMAGYTETVEAARARLSSLLKTASEADVTRAGMYLSHRVRSPNAVNDAALRAALPAIRAELEKIQAHVDSLDLITLAPAFPRGHKTPGATIEYGPYQMKKRYGEHYLARAFFRAAKRDNSIGYVLEQSAIDAQITDPIVLTATGLAEQNRDLAVYHFFMALQYFQEEHAKQNPDAPDVKWIYPDQMVVWRGRQMTVDALQAMLESAQKNFHLNQNPIMRAYAEKEIKGMQALIDANRIDEKSVGDEYIRLPNTPAYGPMRGLLVHRAIHNDLKGTLGIDTINETAPEKALGDFMSFFKQAMTTLNIPKGHTRALFQNVATMYFSGVGTHDVGLVAPSFNLGTWRWFIKSLGYMEQNHELWQLAQELGGRTGTFTTTELRHAYGLVRKLKIQERMNSGDKTAQVQAVFDFIEGAKGIAADMFNFWDTWARFTKFVHEIENNKAAPGDAIIEANEWAPDYSLVPQWVREARNYYIPFLTFFYKLTPKFADQISRVAGHVQRGEVLKAADIALRFASPMMLWTGVTSAAAAAVLGMDDEEHRSLRASMSKYFRENPGVIPMPFRDAEGRIVLIDIGIMFPWTQSVRAGEYLTQGRILEAAGQIGFGHPVVAVGAAWQSDVDPYTGMPLFPETATEAEKNIAYIAFLFNYLTPPPLRGLIDPLIGSLTGQRVQLGGGEFARGIDYFFGDGMTASGKPIEDPPYLAARFLTGFNFNAFEPIDQSNRNARQLAYEIEQVETDRRRAMRDYGNRLRRIRNRPGISAERRESMMAERRRQHLAYLERLDDRRDRLRKKLTEYRADVRAIRAFEREREE